MADADGWLQPLNAGKGNNSAAIDGARGMRRKTKKRWTSIRQAHVQLYCARFQTVSDIKCESELRTDSARRQAVTRSVVSNRKCGGRLRYAR